MPDSRRMETAGARCLAAALLGVLTGVLGAFALAWQAAILVDGMPPPFVT